ncbi:MAG: TetR/AcrR family transcriptional regulator [Candidatus Microthrix parvicella]
MAKRRGRPPRSEVERAAQRTRLTEAAMDAVRAGGGDVSVADIADSAGVSKPVLYAEFGDKNGIADAISVVLADIVELRIPQATGSPSDPPIREIVTAYIDGLVDTVVAEPELRSFIMRSIRSEDRGLVDNALARVVRLRAEVLVGNVGIEVPTDVLTIMIDGLFGFALSAVESWQSVGSPSQDESPPGWPTWPSLRSPPLARATRPPQRRPKLLVPPPPPIDRSTSPPGTDPPIPQARPLQFRNIGGRGDPRNLSGVAPRRWSEGSRNSSPTALAERLVVTPLGHPGPTIRTRSEEPP